MHCDGLYSYLASILLRPRAIRTVPAALPPSCGASIRSFSPGIDQDQMHDSFLVILWHRSNTTTHADVLCTMHSMYSSASAKRVRIRLKIKCFKTCTTSAAVNQETCVRMHEEATLIVSSVRAALFRSGEGIQLSDGLGEVGASSCKPAAYKNIHLRCCSMPPKHRQNNDE